MNKFLAIALLAVVGQVALCELGEETDSQWSIITDDETETKSLTGDQVIFTDFCVASRDHIFGDVKGTTNGWAASVFNIFFKSAEAIGQDAIDTQKLAVERLANQMRNPSADIESGDSEIDNIISQGQKNVQDAEIQPKSIYQAIVATFAAAKTSVTNNAVTAFEKLQASIGFPAALEAMQSACAKVQRYEDDIRAQFDELKSQLDGKYANYKLENVNCVTSKRIVRANVACQLVNAAKGPLMRLLTTRQSSIPQQ